MKTTKTWLRLLSVLALLALATIAIGCGDDEQAGDGASAGNAADAAFIADMTTHHQGAIDMAKLARTRAQHAEIRELADAIVAAQEGEIATMARIRDDMDAMGMDHDGHMGMSDAEMGMDMDMSALAHAKPFDRAFIDAMIPHHEGAIRMARQLLDDGEQPALQRMAHDIIDAQTREIAQMRMWRKAWYGGGAKGHMGNGHMMEMEH